MIDKKKAERIYKKSIEILKKVQLRNGGCLATPKGERYPYVYPRDHAIIILGLLSAGLYKRAKKGLDFVFHRQLPSGAFPQRFDTKGNDASYKPIQIDGTALIIYATAMYYKETKDIEFIHHQWESIHKAVDYIKENFHDEKDLVYTPNSVHEFPPMEDGLEIWANAVCCACMKAIADIASEIHEDPLTLLNYSNSIKAGILRYMWNPRVNSFVKNIRLKESSSVETDVDASTLALSEFGVFDDNDKKIKLNIRRVEKELWNRDLGGLCRYPKYEGRNNGGWGPWPHFVLVLCRHYIRIKDRKNADRCMKWVLDVSCKDELPEHISTVKEFEEYVVDFSSAGLLRKDRLIMIDNARKHPMFRKGTAYITLPLAWPHAEFIITWNLYKQVFLSKK